LAVSSAKNMLKDKGASVAQLGAHALKIQIIHRASSGPESSSPTKQNRLFFLIKAFCEYSNAVFDFCSLRA